jgi:hypothetical protein
MIFLKLLSFSNKNPRQKIYEKLINRCKNVSSIKVWNEKTFIYQKHTNYVETSRTSSHIEILIILR